MLQSYAYMSGLRLPIYLTLVRGPPHPAAWNFVTEY